MVAHDAEPSECADLLKQAPLLAPVDPADEGPQVSLVEALEGRQKKDLFLNVRSQIEQLHDLCHAGPCHPAHGGPFRIIPPQALLSMDEGAGFDAAYRAALFRTAKPGKLCVQQGDGFGSGLPGA